MYWRFTTYQAVAADYALLGCNWVAVPVGPVRKGAPRDAVVSVVNAGLPTAWLNSKVAVCHFSVARQPHGTTVR